jgi:hypothetical protein
MIVEVTFVENRWQQSLLTKEKIVFDMTRSQIKEKIRPDKEQLDLTKEISKLCWRLLEPPVDLFWDDDVKEAMAWYEKEAGSRPKEGNFWPLWTIEDALSWIRKQAGCDVFSIFQFMSIDKVEVYFKLEDGRLVFETGSDLLNILLAFILKRLRGGIECRKS